MRCTRKISWLGLLLASGALAHAQTTLYWDTDGAAPGLGNAGGTWSAPHWTTSSSGEIATGSWVDGSIARFNAFGAASLWLDTNVTAAGLYAAASSGLSLSGPGILTLSPGAVIHNASAMSLGVTLAGNATPGQTAFTLASFYPVYFNASNTYTGQTVVNGGDVAIANAQSLGANGTGNETLFTAGGGQFVHFASDMTLNEGFTFTGYRYLTTPNNSVVNLAGPIVLQGGGNMGLWSGEHLTISGVISEAGGAGTFAAYATLSGANTFTGPLQAGRVVVSTFNNAGVAGPLGAGSSLQLGYEYEGAVGGELVYTGGTATSSRPIQLYGSGTVTIDNPATTLTLTGVIANEGSAFAETNPGFAKAGPGTLVLTGDNTFTGETTLANGTLIVGHSNALGTNSEADVNVGDYRTDYDDDLTLLLANGVSLNKYVDVYNENDDGGLTTLGLYGTGSATFAEEVYIQRSVAVSVGAGGTLIFSELFSDGYGGGGIGKTGAGKAVFSQGLDLRGGGIFVQQGEVLLAGGTVILADPILVSSGAILSGDVPLSHSSSTETTGVVLGSGATFSPGDPLGQFSTPALQMAGGSTLHWQLGALTSTDNAQWDRVAISSSVGDVLEVNSGAMLTVDLSLIAISSRPTQPVLTANDPFWQISQTWLVIDFSGLGTNQLTPGTLNPLLVSNGIWAGGKFDTFVGGGSGAFAGFGTGDLYLRFTPVPEPSTWALLALGGLAVLWPRLRRRA